MTFLRMIREKSNLSQLELATMEGASERAVIRWEQGDPVSMKNLLKLAKALGVTPNDLLGVGTVEKEESK